jgi:hypothetical protein
MPNIDALAARGTVFTRLIHSTGLLAQPRIDLHRLAIQCAAIERSPTARPDPHLFAVKEVAIPSLMPMRGYEFAPGVLEPSLTCTVSRSSRDVLPAVPLLRSRQPAFLQRQTHGRGGRADDEATTQTAIERLTRA